MLTWCLVVVVVVVSFFCLCVIILFAEFSGSKINELLCLFIVCWIPPPPLHLNVIKCHGSYFLRNGISKHPWRFHDSIINNAYEILIYHIMLLNYKTVCLSCALNLSSLRSSLMISSNTFYLEVTSLEMYMFLLPLHLVVKWLLETSTCYFPKCRCDSFNFFRRSVVIIQSQV